MDLKRRIIDRKTGRAFNAQITYDDLTLKLGRLQQIYMFYVATEETLDKVDADLDEITQTYGLNTAPVRSPQGAAIRGFLPARFIFPDTDSDDVVSLVVEFDYEMIED